MGHSSGSALLAGLLARLSGVNAAQLGLGRVGVGVSMITRPSMLPRALGIDSASASAMSWSTRMLGAREIALGLGAVTALRRGDAAAARLWLYAGMFSDGVDALTVGTGAARGRLHPLSGAGVTAVACAAVVVQLSALQEQRAR